MGAFIARPHHLALVVGTASVTSPFGMPIPVSRTQDQGTKIWPSQIGDRSGREDLRRLMDSHNDARLPAGGVAPNWRAGPRGVWRRGCDMAFSVVHTIAGFGARDASASWINLEMRTASLNRTPDFDGDAHRLHDGHCLHLCAANRQQKTGRESRRYWPSAACSLCSRTLARRTGFGGPIFSWLSRCVVSMTNGLSAVYPHQGPCRCGCRSTSNRS